jgi:DamX protein
MSALENNIGLFKDNNSVTKISAHARIDYILRFSKQAILVIDESVEQNSPLCSQFLATLPEQHNAAYISLSGQFNNIQIRCRIIEQLYTGELFDPEISLAVSVINLAKKSQQAISIVLDNAQHLSLQILHELSQLSAIANKANLLVNIVMFGTPKAGKIVAGNKSLFDNKLTLLSAQSGQLLSTTAAIFKNTGLKWQFIHENKWLLSIIAIMLGFTALVIVLLQQETFKFTQGLIASNPEHKSLNAALAKPQTMALASNRYTPSEVPASNSILKKINAAALPEDIYLSLINSRPAPTIESTVLPASHDDIITAIIAEGKSTLTVESLKIDSGDSKIETPGTTEKNTVVHQLTVNNDYYANQSGFVIQLAAFSDLQLPSAFVDTLMTLDFHIYQRLLNNKPVVVITSEIYADKSAAKFALSQLPEALLARQPWIKSATVINDEIKAFLQAQ